MSKVRYAAELAIFLLAAGYGFVALMRQDQHGVLYSSGVIAALAILGRVLR